MVCPPTFTSSLFSSIRTRLEEQVLADLRICISSLISSQTNSKGGEKICQLLMEPVHKEKGQ